MRPKAEKPKPDRAVQLIAKKKLWSAIASECGIQKDAIRQWFVVPPLRVLAVSRVIGKPPHWIRPDLYEAPDKGTSGQSAA